MTNHNRNGIAYKITVYRVLTIYEYTYSANIFRRWHRIHCPVPGTYRYVLYAYILGYASLSTLPPSSQRICCEQIPYLYTYLEPHLYKPWSYQTLMASSPLEESGTPHELEHPPIVPGGSLSVTYQIRGKRVLIIGGGYVLSPSLAPPPSLLTYQ